MHQITVVGRVYGEPVEVGPEKKRYLVFTVQSEDTSSDEPMQLNFSVVTSKLSLKARLRPGTDIYVTGMFNPTQGKTYIATIQALAIHIIDPRPMTTEEMSASLLMTKIPLSSI